MQYMVLCLVAILWAACPVAAQAQQVKPRTTSKSCCCECGPGCTCGPNCQCPASALVQRTRLGAGRGFARLGVRRGLGLRRGGLIGRGFGRRLSAGRGGLRGIGDGLLGGNAAAAVPVAVPYHYPVPVYAVPAAPAYAVPLAPAVGVSAWRGSTGGVCVGGSCRHVGVPVYRGRLRWRR